jgi:hypothetical protein
MNITTTRTVRNVRPLGPSQAGTSSISWVR